MLGSDHAPHTIEEKAKPYPASPSGMPGVQTLVPLLLNHVAQGRLSLRRFIELTSAGPQRVFGLVGKGRIAIGYDADFTVVDLKKQWTVGKDWLASRCDWSPFEGDQLDLARQQLDPGYVLLLSWWLGTEFMCLALARSRGR